MGTRYVCVCVHSNEIAVLGNMQEEKDLLVCQISDNQN
jgi:hypothetical protein